MLCISYPKQKLLYLKSIYTFFCCRKSLALRFCFTLKRQGHQLHANSITNFVDKDINIIWGTLRHL